MGHLWAWPQTIAYRLLERRLENIITFRAKCSKCGHEFDCYPGRLNSTVYLGPTSKNKYLPKCPECENWRDNQLLGLDGKLTEVLRY